MVFPHETVRLAAEPHYHISEHPVIHIKASLPDNISCIDPQGVSLLDMVIEQSRKQIIGRSNGMKISGKMQVQILHRHNLGITASRRTALDAETGPKGRLP